MGFWSRFLLRPTQQSFVTCLRLIQVDLYSDLRHEYAAEMEKEPASILAAQVVNFLKSA